MADTVPEQPGQSEAPEPDWKRRRRLAEIFGDVEPSTTGDERDPGSGATPGAREDAGERWLKAQVPPHHGG